MALDIGPFKRKKKVDDDPKESKRRRKRAREQAVKGYKRKGGLLEKLRKAFGTFKDMPEKIKRR